MLFVGGHACFVWWVVVVCGSLGWMSHIISGLAVVVCGQSYLFCVMVGMDGCAPCCSWILTGGSCGCLWAVVPVQCCGGQFVGGWCSLLWVLKPHVTQPH